MIETGMPASKPRVTNLCSPVAEPVIFEGERYPLEHASSVLEVDAMRLEILRSLGFVPGEFHDLIVYTRRNYEKRTARRGLSRATAS